MVIEIGEVAIVLVKRKRWLALGQVRGGTAFRCKKCHALEDNHRREAAQLLRAAYPITPAAKAASSLRITSSSWSALGWYARHTLPMTVLSPSSRTRIGAGFFSSARAAGRKTDRSYSDSALAGLGSDSTATRNG